MKKIVSFTAALSLFFNLAAVSLCAAGPAAAKTAAKPKGGIDLFTLNDAAKPGTITINQAINAALQNNTAIKTAEKNAEIYDQQVRQYWSYVYPRITLSGSYTRALEQQETIIPALGGKVKTVLRNSTSAQAEAALLLWKGGAVSAGIKMGDYFSQSGYLRLLEAQNKIKDTVTVLCFRIVISHALIQVQQENLNIAQNHLKEINLKYKQGLASDLDILNQKVKISNSEPPLIQAKNAYEIGLLTLRRVLNKDPQDPIDLYWQLEDIMQINFPPLEELYKIAREYRPDLAVARLNTKIAEQNIKIARADNYGEISAFVNGTYSGASDSVLMPMSESNSSYGANAGLRISIPLFEGFRVDSIIKQRELAYDQALLLEQDTERGIKVEVKQAWLNLNEAKQRISATKGTIEQARTNLERTTLRYRNGLASRLDLDDSALLLYNAELQFVQAVHDAFTALSNLNYAVGKEVIVK
ncbi:MAG: TolC family protein [Elusimicrobiota bacterium]|jgi:outer membrane protein TolC|nr:TolC family protein [Elusimicrobiota bacterium]